MAEKAEELVKEAIKKAAEEELKARKADSDKTDDENCDADKPDETAGGETEASCGTADDSEETEEDAADDSNDAAECSTADGEKKKLGSLFKKKDKKDKRDEKIAELNDRLMRNMAEFDNFRKRTEREKAQMFEVGAKSIVEKILPTIDNFERGLATLTEEEKTGAFAQGMEKVYKQLLTSLDEAGVKQIEAMGKEFDPNFHNAVMHEENSELGENIVSQELQKGYMYRDSVVRHSMVKVAN